MGFWFFFTFLAVFSERVVSIDGPNPAPDIVTIVSFPPPPPPNDSFYLFLLFSLIYFFFCPLASVKLQVQVQVDLTNEKKKNLKNLKTFSTLSLTAFE